MVRAASRPRRFWTNGDEGGSRLRRGSGRGEVAPAPRRRSPPRNGWRQRLCCERGYHAGKRCQERGSATLAIVASARGIRMTIAPQSSLPTSEVAMPNRRCPSALALAAACLLLAAVARPRDRRAGQHAHARGARRPAGACSSTGRPPAAGAASRRPTSPRDGWAVADGCLKKVATGAGDSLGSGDIVTVRHLRRLRPALRVAHRAGRQQRREVLRHRGALGPDRPRVPGARRRRPSRRQGRHAPADRRVLRRVASLRRGQDAAAGRRVQPEPRARAAATTSSTGSTARRSSNTSSAAPS